MKRREMNGELIGRLQEAGMTLAADRLKCLQRIGDDPDLPDILPGSIRTLTELLALEPRLDTGLISMDHRGWLEVAWQLAQPGRDEETLVMDMQPGIAVHRPGHTVEPENDGGNSNDRTGQPWPQPDDPGTPGRKIK